VPEDAALVTDEDEERFGYLIAQTATGQTAPVSLAPFDPGRFEEPSRA